MSNSTNQTLLVVNALTEHWRQISSRTLFKFSISVSLQDNFISPHALQHFLRTLINSKHSVGNIENREFFKKYFQGGGVHYTTVIQEREDVYPMLIFHIYGLSNSENMNEGTVQSLKRRIHKIIPSAVIKVSAPHQLKSAEDAAEQMIGILSTPSLIYMNSSIFQTLPKHTRRWLIDVLNCEIRCFGTLYHLVHQNYKLDKFL